MSHACVSLLGLIELANQVFWFGRKKDVKSHGDMQQIFGVTLENTFNELCLMAELEPKLERDAAPNRWTLLIATRKVFFSCTWQRAATTDII